MKLYKMATVDEKLKDPIQVIMPDTGMFVLMICINPCDDCLIEQWDVREPSQDFISKEFCSIRCKFGGS